MDEAANVLNYQTATNTELRCCIDEVLPKPTYNKFKFLPSVGVCVGSVQTSASSANYASEAIDECVVELKRVMNIM